MALMTYEQAVLKLAHREIEVGTKRSVAALYTLMLPFMLAYHAENETAIQLPQEYVFIHQAIRERWPGADKGIKSLDGIKKLAWDHYKAMCDQEPQLECTEVSDD